MTRTTYEDRYQSWLKRRFAPPPEPDTSPSTPTLIEMAPLRDGVRLYTEVYLPSTQGPFPVVLIRSPYPFTKPSRNDRWPIRRYTDAGYAFVFQLTRGQGASEGVFQYFRGDVADGRDCIEWIAAQPWCNGSVGMEGASYSGCMQWYAARTKPDALKCIAPTAFVGNFTASYPFSGGVPIRGVLLQWFKVVDASSMAELDAPYGDMSILTHPRWGPALRKRPLLEAADGILSGDKLDAWREVILHPRDDEHWRGVHFTDEELGDIDLPILFTDGWFDLTVGPLEFFARMERHARGREHRYLLVGPWDHFQTYASHVHDRPHGDRPMPKNGAVDLVGGRLAFFDRYLRGDTTVQLQPQRVRVYIGGIDEWRDYPTFPVPGTQQRQLYLHSAGAARSFRGDGKLSWESPALEPPDTYLYDPVFPAPSEAEFCRDRREIEIRADVLVYTSEPLTAPLTVLGEITLVLHVASDAPDTDFFARVTEVMPDGRSIAFHNALPAIRARYREGRDREVMLPANEPVKLRIPLGAAGHCFAPGSRLRLAICSAEFPMFDPNTNTGAAAATDTGSRVAHQTVFHDALRPSHVVIPVIEA